MAYIGNDPSNRFVAPKAASVFSGDGSTTAFTLDHAVGSDEDILVSVDGVIQEPSVAYAVSSGTTLTFTAAPSSNSGNNIFVYYLFRTVGTVSHPSNNALTATNGTLTGTLDVTGATTLSSDVTIGDASAADKKILFDGNAQDFHIGLDDSADSLTIGLGSALGTTSHMVIDANGHVTKPSQPMFNASEASTRSDMGTDATIAMNFDQITDVNSDYADDPGTFTAPVTGKYLLTVCLVMLQVDKDYTSIEVILNTSNRDYSNVIDPRVFGADANHWSMTTTAVADMDAGDTAKVNFVSSGGAVQLDISASSHFSGALLC